MFSVAFKGGQHALDGGMIAYLLTDCALGIGGCHLVSIDLHLNLEAGLMLS
jgi:hypothetical protein